MEEKRTPSIVAIATKYGLILGVLLFAVFAVAGVTQSRVPLLIELVLLVVLMVLAHREFTRANGRMMRYSQGLGSGTLLASIAGLVACILTYVYVRFIDTGYTAAAKHAVQVSLQQRGITGAQAQQTLAIYGAIMTPVGAAVATLIIWIILGFIAALIVSIFTQRGDPRVVV